MKSHDIIIVGSGYAGLAAAAVCISAGFSVKILERSKPTKKDGRGLFISNKTLEFFSEIGIVIPDDDTGTLEHIYVYEEGQRPVLELSKPGGLGRVVPAAVLMDSILKALPHDIIEYEEVNDVSESAGFINVNNRKAKLLIACDGKRSPIAEKYGIKRYSSDYSQIACVFDITHEEGHKNVAIESFCGKEILAILPAFEHNASSVIWSIPDNALDFVKNLNDEEFLGVLNKKAHRARHIGKITGVSLRSFFPLSISAIKKQTHGRTLFIGDSFNAMHPIAGQSFNMTVKDMINLHKYLLDCKKCGLDVGSPSGISRMARKNILHHLGMNAATHGLAKLFGIESGVVQKLRNVGIAATERIPFVKNICKRFAGA